MFLADSELGRTDPDKKLPKVIRYLKSCSIKVKALGKENTGQILPPLLELVYGEMTLAQIEENESVEIRLEVDWEMEKSPLYSVQVIKKIYILYKA